MSAAPEVVENRVPPQDLDAEAALLCTMFVAPEVAGQLSAILRPEDFYSEAHRQIFKAALAVHARGAAVDAIVVMAELRATERLAQAGGAEYVTNVTAAAAAIVNVAKYAKIVRSKARCRATIEAAHRAVVEGYLAGGADEEYLAATRQRIDEATRLSDAETLTGNTETLGEMLTSIRRAAQTGSMVTGIPTGIDRYDRLTLGLHAKQLTIVGARPGAGKSAFGGTVATNLARAGIGALFFSLEMSREEIVTRIVSSMARIDGTSLKTGQLSSLQWERLHVAARDMAALPLWIDDKTGLTVQDIRARAFGAIEQTRRLKTALGLIVVDYLQKVAVPAADRRKGRYEQVGDIAKGMKQLARETGLPVLCLAQLRRADKGRDRKAPTMDDLRESGDIEQEADVITLIHEPESETRELLIEKARGGRRGRVEVSWRPELTLFENAPDLPYQGPPNERFT